MNRRHAAALALVGWYLMVPLARDGQVLDRPLAQWIHLDSYDSATECRDNGYLFEEKRKKEGDPTKIASASAFECIASDDPRLKEK